MSSRGFSEGCSEECCAGALVDTCCSVNVASYFLLGHANERIVRYGTINLMLLILYNFETRLEIL